MEVSNALTAVRGDARYVKKLFNTEDMFDNITNYLVLGEVVDFEHFEVEYVFFLPISGRSHHGNISISVINLTTAEIASHSYAYPDSEPEIETITYTADVDTGIVRLGVGVSSVGENPTFNYRIAATPAAV